MLTKIYWLCLFFIFSPIVFSASFDCTKASNDVEKIICNTSYISDLDIRLGNEYRLLMSSEINSDIKSELLRSQREWLRDRNQCINTDCLIEKYTNRISELCVYSFNFSINPNCQVILERETSNTENLVTKSDFRQQKIDILSSEKELSDDPLKAKMAVCTVDILIDKIFENSEFMNKVVAEERFKSITMIGSSMSEIDPLIELKVMRCLLNSDEILQSIHEQKIQEENSNSSRNTSALPLMDIDDLVLDISTLNGKKIRVFGEGIYMMDMFMLQKGVMDMNPIIVKIDNLPREKRREILQRCSDIFYLCEITVTGTVNSGEYNFIKTIIAEDIEW